MLIADLRHHMNTNLTVMYGEFMAICGRNLQAASLLSNLFWWLDVADKKYPERQGWIYKTAEQLEAEIGLTRRGYEKARKMLLNLGIIKYKRAQVHGKMFWAINREKLFELIYKVRGETPPDFESEYYTDADGFMLNKWIPEDLWNAYLKMRHQKNGRHVSQASKKILYNQLSELHKKNINLRLVMEKAIAAGWGGFYPPNKDYNAPPQKQDTQREAEAIWSGLEADIKARETKPPDKDPENPGRKAILKFIKKSDK